MSRISGLRNDMNKRTFYKERKINNRCFDFLSKQNIIVPLILDMNEINNIIINAKNISDLIGLEEEENKSHFFNIVLFGLVSESSKQRKS